ncbi:MAG: division/cell wall cluster transcriptional repressor MraZ [Gammaproteobacteria bacterium]|nr:division/cell wall cluster transcriptional repressor MraZ [Gammaproteobacteria bacterium]
MFRGDYALSMDPKGRLAIPTRYRDRLDEVCAGKLVITISLLERCLSVYPAPEWQRIEKTLESLPALDQKAQAISHLLIGHALECDLDGQGRILISQTLRDFAGLDKRVRMVGQVRRFELWDEQTWTARREQLLSEVEDLRSNPSEALRDLVL